MKRAPIPSCDRCPVGVAGGDATCAWINRGRPAGAYVYFEGEPATSIWFVKRGTVALRRGAGGEDRAHALRGPGSILGLEALVQPSYADTARCLDEVSLCRIARPALDGWLGQPGTGRALLELSVRQSAEDPVRASAPDGSAERRVARWILAESDGAGVCEGIPRRLVADLLGIVPETLSRAIARLVEIGAIEATRTRLAILDRARLELLADL